MTPCWKMPLAAAVIAAGLALPTAAPAQPETLADSTVAERWTLANGLRVETRHIPRARAVAVVMSYRIGSASDPAGREGQAALLAELAFRGAARGTPERSRDELLTLRPLGWNLRVTPYLTHLAEIAAPAQFPGVLHQVAARAAGVEVSESLFRSALEVVREDLAERHSGSVEHALHYLLRDLAATGSPERTGRYGAGRGLEGITAREAAQRVRRTFVPANAVLSLAGNLEGFDVRRLVDREFGAIPAGTALPPPQPTRLAAGSHRVEHPGLTRPLGGLGVIGPALTDTLHPSFSLHALLLGGLCKSRWGPPPHGPLTTRFEYALLDDPELVRLYPDVPPDPDDRTPVIEELHLTLSEVPPVLGREAYEDALVHVTWMIGGPLPEPMMRRMRREPGALYTLASGMGARAQWGDETFWSEYRRRFDAAAGRDFAHWRNALGDPARILQVRLVPIRPGAAR